MADYQTVLSKEIEDYKEDISKELEKYKFQLQSDFQTKFYEFQTRYSVSHQKQAEVIETLFELLADFFNQLQKLANWENLLNAEKVRGNTSLTKGQKFYDTARESYDKFADYYDKKRVYLDKNVQNNIIKFINVTLMLMSADVFPIL